MRNKFLLLSGQAFDRHGEYALFSSWHSMASYLPHCKSVRNIYYDFKPCAVLMQGIPGSGKSTLACKLGLPIISFDACREELYGDASIQGSPKQVANLANEQMQTLVQQNQSFVLDNSHCYQPYLYEARQVVERFGYVPLLLSLDSSMQQALLNIQKRSRKVPAHIVYSMHQQKLACCIRSFEHISFVY